MVSVQSPSKVGKFRAWRKSVGRSSRSPSPGGNIAEASTVNATPAASVHSGSDVSDASEPPSTGDSQADSYTSGPSTSRSESPSRSSGCDSSNESPDIVKHQIMVNYLCQQQANNGWRSNAEGEPEEVVLRVSRDNYLSYPPDLADTQMGDALRELNVQSAMTVHSPVIRAYLASHPWASEMPMLNGLAVQIVPNIAALARARSNQSAAVVATKAMLVVWDDNAVDLLARAKKIEFEVLESNFSGPRMVQTVRRCPGARPLRAQNWPPRPISWRGCRTRKILVPSKPWRQGHDRPS